MLIWVSLKGTKPGCRYFGGRFQLFNELFLKDRTFAHQMDRIKTDKVASKSHAI